MKVLILPRVFDTRGPKTLLFPRFFKGFVYDCLQKVLKTLVFPRFLSPRDPKSTPRSTPRWGPRWPPRWPPKGGPSWNQKWPFRCRGGPKSGNPTGSRQASIPARFPPPNPLPWSSLREANCMQRPAQIEALPVIRQPPVERESRHDFPPPNLPPWSSLRESKLYATSSAW